MSKKDNFKRTSSFCDDKKSNKNGEKSYSKKENLGRTSSQIRNRKDMNNSNNVLSDIKHNKNYDSQRNSSYGNRSKNFDSQSSSKYEKRDRSYESKNVSSNNKRNKNLDSTSVSSCDYRNKNYDSQSVSSPSSKCSIDSDSQSVIGKRFIKTYDANIELRQVGDRIRKRKSTSWADQSLLNDEEEIDYLKYSEKMKRSEKNIVLEDDLDKLARRQGDIDKGKVKGCYQQYVYEVDKKKRQKYQPRTPNKFLKMSRRGWDGVIKKWKKHIHAWQEPNFEDLYAAGLQITCCGSEVSSVSSFKSHMSETEEPELSSRDDFSDEEEDTVKEPFKSRKRRLSNESLTETDEKTLEAYPNKLDLHSGLTNDANVMTISKKKQKLSEI